MKIQDHKLVSRRPGSGRRSRRQRGNEMFEFALVLALLGPLFLWMFVNSMNLLRMIQTNAICRDVGILYIQGMDFSTWLAQSVAQTLAQGYDLEIGSSYSGNNATNDGNSGNGWVVLSEIMYVGSASCSTLPSGTTCSNEGQYVYLQRFDFGNSSVIFNGSGVSSQVGTPTASINSSGYVQNYLTDPGAVAPNFSRFMQTQLSDGQIIYVAETFFASPDLHFSSYPGGGVYSRTFF
jgi:hypothetical protein